MVCVVVSDRFVCVNNVSGLLCDIVEIVVFRLFIRVGNFMVFKVIMLLILNKLVFLFVRENCIEYLILCWGKSDSILVFFCIKFFKGGCLRCMILLDIGVCKCGVLSSVFSLEICCCWFCMVFCVDKMSLECLSESLCIVFWCLIIVRFSVFFILVLVRDKVKI